MHHSYTASVAFSWQKANTQHYHRICSFSRAFMANYYIPSGVFACWIQQRVRRLFYINGTNSITQISGESSVLIIESNVNGAITPHLLINKKQKWYITSDILYSFCHADDCWDDEYSVYYLSHPLIDETYWMVCDTSDCTNIYETVTAFGEHDSGTRLEYVDSIGKKTYWFFHTDDGYLPLYVNGLFANDYCYTKDFRRET